MQVKENKALEVLLREKVAKEKQKYSDLSEKYQDLQNSLLLGSEIHTGSLQEEIVKERQKYSDLQGKYEELIKSVSLDSGIQTELSKLQVTMETVTISLGKVEVIKNYWSDKVYTSTHDMYEAKQLCVIFLTRVVYFKFFVQIKVKSLIPSS